MTTTTTDRIEKEIVLRAPRSRVWRAITDSKEFGTWFQAVFAEAFRPGARLKGKVTYHYGDCDEVFETGDAFYVPAGHTPEIAAGTEFIQFSPSEELRVVSEKMLANARELQLI